MISRPKENDIAPENPFANDDFERAPFAIGLVKLLSSIQGPLTLALTGAYGAGKTHFLSRCKVMLENQDVPVVLLNAWETDFASEPIAPLITELTEKFSSKLTKGNQKIKKIKRLAAKLPVAAIPLGIKVLTAGVLDAKDLEDTLPDAFQKAAEDQFKKFEASKQSIKALRDELTKLAEEIRPKTNPRPPVVIIIDELDRCRPNYAIELLEVVKHLFTIPGIVFVLGIDRDQLASSASAVFGQGLDTDGYLRRFIDLECALPKPDIARFCAVVGHKIIQETTGKSLNVFVENSITIGKLCHGAGFSIRKTHQFLTRLAIAISAGGNDESADVITLLTFLHAFDLKIYKQFVDGKATAWEVYEHLKKLHPRILNNDRARYSGFLWVLALAGKDDRPEPFLTRLRTDFESNNESVTHLDQIERYGVGSGWENQLKCLIGYVDFGAAFVCK